MAFTPRSSTTSIPSPPRLSGDPKLDLISLREWMAQFFSAAVRESGLLDPDYQASGADEIEPTNLPDPARTTIARAQATANLAVTMASDLQKRPEVAVAGAVVVSNTDDTGSAIFPADIGTTDYRVSITPADYSGSPSVDAFRVIKVTKGSGGLTIEVTSAPGSGTSITFDYIVVKDN